MTRKIPFPGSEFSKFEEQYINLWREKKKYPKRDFLSVGDVIELLLATTYTLEQEGSDTRFFNFCLHNEESVISWDGEDPVYIWVYQIQKNIKKIIATGRTFNQTIDIT
jgi:hypothetical protein